jgi:hypothetical protein
MSYIHYGKHAEKYIQLTSKSIILPTNLISDKDFNSCVQNYTIVYISLLTYMNSDKINSDKYKWLPLNLP